MWPSRKTPRKIRPGLLELTELEPWTCAAITVDRPLRLVDLRGDALIRMGVPTDAIRGSSHALGQAWSAAFWTHDMRPDGLIYSSRLNEEANIAVYDRALTKLNVRARPRLLDCRAELAACLNDLSVALV